MVAALSDSGKSLPLIGSSVHYELIQHAAQVIEYGHSTDESVVLLLTHLYEYDELRAISNNNSNTDEDKTIFFSSSD